MKQEIGKALLVVFMEPDAEAEGEFNEWYNKYHVPERVSVPGILSARRYELCEGEGRLSIWRSTSWKTRECYTARLT